MGDADANEPGLGRSVRHILGVGSNPHLREIFFFGANPTLLLSIQTPMGAGLLCPNPPPTPNQTHGEPFILFLKKNSARDTCVIATAFGTSVYFERFKSISKDNLLSLTNSLSVHGYCSTTMSNHELISRLNKFAWELFLIYATSFIFYIYLIYFYLLNIQCDRN
jgi:hypothetical protein